MAVNLDECLFENTNSIVKVGEKRSKATFANHARENYKVYNNDKCVMAAHNGPKADFVLHHEKHGELIVELKGRGIEDAVKQVTETYKFWRENDLFKGPNQGALIVCTHVPHAAAAQKAQNEFMRVHRKKLG